MEYYSRSENESGEKELLSYHLERTSQLCGGFADDFGCKDAGTQLGNFHDLGKATPKFQEVLKHKNHESVNHCAAGALFIRNNKKTLLRTMLSDIIYAHHSELNFCSYREFSKSLNEKYDNNNRRFSASGQTEYKDVADFKKENAITAKKPEFPFDLNSLNEIEIMLLYRMLYSCLVDADWSSSAEHNNKNYLKETSGGKLDCDRLIDSLNKYRAKLKAKSSSASSINNVRDILFEECVRASKLASGLFTLTAPTGSGKTLAMLAFALNHAKETGKRRIIFVLPFLSVIEQNAEIYREICGDVLEIHSQTDYPEEIREMSERFDAPIIVTTSVRFFETLFRNKSSDCRGLHNFSDSVIVFDEAQTLPAELTKATLKSVNALCSLFRSTVVFSTATQPEFSCIDGLEWNPCEIVSSKKFLFSETKRTTLNMELSKTVSFEDIAERMSELDSVCCIVNKKAHSYELFNLLKDIAPDGCYHISTDMCVEHRKNTLYEIHKRLENGEPCRVVSTSCIEAGVDLDFENMFRALAPLEAIVQSAGRCNRNGRGKGNVTVFIPDKEKLYPTPWYEVSASKVQIVCSRHELDIDNPEHIKEYYETLFSGGGTENAKLDTAIKEMDFPAVSKLYKFIDNSAVNILVPYEKCIDEYNMLKAEAEQHGISKQWIRRAAKISVSCYDREKVKEICEEVFFIIKGEKHHSGWYILNDKKFYDNKAGFHIDDDSSLDYII
ncbi:MAG: CRISPR-associated helicase Cas3' [Acutalibacteraceae bacterium]